MLVLVVIIGIISGVVFYNGTISSYKKAGAGQTYSISASTDVKLTGRSDVRSGTRSRVDHGFYSGSVSASGRAQAYHMPQGIKHTIQMVQSVSQSGRPPQSRPQNNRPSRPSMDRPAGHRGQGGPRGSGRR